MNEPEDEIKAHSDAGSKSPASSDSLRRATMARTRETLGKRDSVDLERAFHWAHFQDTGP